MILKILACKAKPFKGNDGVEVSYFWCVGEKADGVSVQFGTSADLTNRIGEKLEIALTETIGADQKKRYTAVKLD